MTNGLIIDSIPQLNFTLYVMSLDSNQNNILIFFVDCYKYYRFFVIDAPQSLCLFDSVS